MVGGHHNAVVCALDAARLSHQICKTWESDGAVKQTTNTKATGSAAFAHVSAQICFVSAASSGTTGSCKNISKRHNDMALTVLPRLCLTLCSSCPHQIHSQLLCQLCGLLQHVQAEFLCTAITLNRKNQPHSIDCGWFAVKMLLGLALQHMENCQRTGSATDRVFTADLSCEGLHSRQEHIRAVAQWPLKGLRPKSAPVMLQRASICALGG